jgi:hypothetical protein
MARSRARSAWSKLTEKGRARLRQSGVNPHSYNAWYRRKPEKRATVSRDDFLRGRTPEQQRRKQAAPAPEKRQEAEDRLYTLHGGSPWAKRRTIHRGIESMSPSELDIALTAPREKIQKLARRPPDGRITPDGDERDFNPFWYK